jgi:hypothetical protein
MRGGGTRDAAATPALKRANGTTVVPDLPQARGSHYASRANLAAVLVQV